MIDYSAVIITYKSPELMITKEYLAWHYYKFETNA